MLSTKKALFIPYKHIALVIVLTIIMVTLWAYTPQADSLTSDTTIAIPLEIPLSSTTKTLAYNTTNAAIVKSEKVLTPAKSTSLKLTDPLEPEPSIPPEQLLPEQLPPEQLPPEQLSAEQRPPSKLTASEPREHKVVIRSGDTLSVLFDTHKLGQTTLHNILSADESLLALETLRPGQILYFRYKENTQQLEEMELYKRLGHRVVYRRINDNTFDYENIIQEGKWRDKRISGKIKGTFYLSAQRAGLTEIETANVTRIFQDQLNFARAIRKGDQFQIVRSIEYINGQATGQTRIKSARIQRRVHEHTAFLFNDGRYYDKQGKSLARAFTRTPLAKSYRISSHFNPRRVHPVTGRIGPHNGTDFATPNGTRVLSTGDGVVTRVGNHPYAGRYVDIKHGGQYKTRYLHLQRVLVRRGQSISRGQVIARSGNSGRSTGPHLHFELHVNGRPVDPMKAKIPVTKSIPKKHKNTFKQIVAEQTRLLDTQQKATEVAINTTSD